MTKYQFIDLFCGAGGLGIGLKKAGFEPALSLDFDNDSVNTLKSYNDHEIIHGDIIKFINDLETGIRKLPKIDLVAGGPPCQGFCAINPNRSENDPRNSLVDAFLHAVELIQPQVVLLENVTGLLSLAKGYAIKKIEKRLKNLRYNVSYKVLQAAHYGAPQSRWRLFVVGYKKDNFEFPKPKYSARIVPNFIRGKELTLEIPNDDLFNNFEKPVTVWDAISDLPELKNGQRLKPNKYSKKSLSDYQVTMRQNSNFIHNHETKSLQPINFERILALPNEGMNWSNLPDNLMPNNLRRLQEKYKGAVGSKTRFGRLKKDGFFSTIVTSPDPYWGAFIHPTQNRVISVRETARAQSFEDKITFSGSLNSMYRQIGNAVPPILATAIGKKIIEAL